MSDFNRPERLSVGEFEGHKTTVEQTDGAVWHSLNFASLEDAVYFVNLPPAQGGGEFVFSNNTTWGGVDVAYYL